MKAVDTNVVVRVLTGDDMVQTAIASEAIAGGVFISSGVLIETEWVLRAIYSWQRDRIAAGLTRLFKEKSVNVVNADRIGWAVDRYADGADWADMIHLLDAANQDCFLTFDRALQKRAAAFSPLPIELLA